MKHQADKKRHEMILHIDDDVLVKLQPYRQHAATLERIKNGQAKIVSVAYRLSFQLLLRFIKCFMIMCLSSSI